MSFESDQPDPTKLADALRAAYAHRPAIPPSVDTAILAAARESFDARRRRRMTIRWATGLAASLAAALTLAVILHRPPAPPTQLAKSGIKGDLNADGRVDMLDAFLLAKHVAAHDALDRNWDANADGVVDQKDIDALAMTAVHLNQSAAAAAAAAAVPPLPVPRGRAGVGASLASQTAPASLPTFDNLGLTRLPVGLASASGISDPPTHLSLAKASPTKPANSSQEAPQ